MGSRLARLIAAGHPPASITGREALGPREAARWGRLHRANQLDDLILLLSGLEALRAGQGGAFLRRLALRRDRLRGLDRRNPDKAEDRPTATAGVPGDFGPEDLGSGDLADPMAFFAALRGMVGG